MLTELFLAGRYLIPRKSAVSFITLTSILGVTLGVTVLMVVLAAAAPSLVLPFVFKNGSEKGRMAYLFVLAIVFALGSAGMILLSKLGMVNEQIVLPLPGILTAVAVLMYPASWALSVHWYEKREF